MYYVKLPPYLHVQSRPFAADTHVSETIKEGGPEAHIPSHQRVHNTVRWRKNGVDEAGEERVRTRAVTCRNWSPKQR